MEGQTVERERRRVSGGTTYRRARTGFGVNLFQISERTTASSQTARRVISETYREG